MAKGDRNERGQFGPSNGFAFKKGVSGNPSGTTKNPFPRLIRKKSKDGKIIVDRVWKIFTTSKSEKTVLWAAEWLRDTGWHRPVSGLAGVDGDGNLVPTVSFVPAEYPDEPAPGGKAKRKGKGHKGI